MIICYPIAYPVGKVISKVQLTIAVIDKIPVSLSFYIVNLFYLKPFEFSMTNAAYRINKADTFAGFGCFNRA